MLVAVVLPYVSVGLLEDLIQASIYRFEGHAWDVSWRAAEVRTVLSAHIGLAFMPLTIVASITPLLEWIPARRRRWLAFVAVLVFGLALTTLMNVRFVVVSWPLM